MNGSGPHEGRLEIYLNNTWKTVCDHYIYYFTYQPQVASIVCGQLGYISTGRYVIIIMRNYTVYVVATVLVSQ